MAVTIPDWLGAALLLSFSDELHTRLVWGPLRNHYLLLGAYLRVRHSPLFVWFVHESLELIFHAIILSLVLPVTMALTAALLHFSLDLVHEALLGTLRNPYLHRAFHLGTESAVLYCVWG